MKILKPGKVEMRKFVCPDCGCVFLASKIEINADIDLYVCPQDGCHYYAIGWEDGEPYEEPTRERANEKRLWGLIQEWDWNHVGVQGMDKFLIENGVTFRD